jgi:hypothetical protein
MSNTIINALRQKCKNEADHYFVDTLEITIKEFEKPREPINRYEGVCILPEYTSEFLKNHGLMIESTTGITTHEGHITNAALIAMLETWNT